MDYKKLESKLRKLLPLDNYAREEVMFLLKREMVKISNKFVKCLSNLERLMPRGN